MTGVVAYHRPASLDEAAGLLAGPDRVPLAGGTVVNTAGWDRAVEVVDLQSCGLGQVDGRTGRIGAMTRLQTLVDTDALPTLVRDLARRELPSTLRTIATVGGSVAAAGPDSVLVAALAVHDAVVEFHRSDAAPLADVLAEGVGDRLITAVRIDGHGEGAFEATGRTPADVPIVSAVGRAVGDDVRLALTGVASTPVAVDPADPVAGLEPGGDFRGSAAYRLHLATVLSRRVVDALGRRSAAGSGAA